MGVSDWIMTAAWRVRGAVGKNWTAIGKLAPTGTLAGTGGGGLNRKSAGLGPPIETLVKVSTLPPTFVTWKSNVGPGAPTGTAGNVRLPTSTCKIGGVTTHIP